MQESHPKISDQINSSISSLQIPSNRACRPPCHYNLYQSIPLLLETLYFLGLSLLNFRYWWEYVWRIQWNVWRRNWRQVKLENRTMTAKYSMYIWVIYQAWGQDGWIFAKFFFVFLWTETESRSINLEKKNKANIQPSWPKKLGQ